MTEIPLIWESDDGLILFRRDRKAKKIKHAQKVTGVNKKNNILFSGQQ